MVLFDTVIYAPEIELYFANENRDTAGAIYIFETTATGKTLQVRPLRKILDKMSELEMTGQPLGRPLLFAPPN